jgi:peroxiredoxin Q/BCP
VTARVGEKAPDFVLPSTTGDSIRLSDLVSAGTVVLFFYPKDDTLGCTIEACSFRDLHGAFAAAGAQIVGISSDSLESHEHFASKHRLPMKLLSDVDGTVRALYGVRPTLGILPGRATFVIDPTGTVRSVFESQLRFQEHADRALEVVKGLRAGA